MVWSIQDLCSNVVKVLNDRVQETAYYPQSADANRDFYLKQMTCTLFPLNLMGLDFQVSPFGFMALITVDTDWRMWAGNAKWETN